MGFERRHLDIISLIPLPRYDSIYNMIPSLILVFEWIQTLSLYTLLIAMCRNRNKIFTATKRKILHFRVKGGWSLCNISLCYDLYIKNKYIYTSTKHDNIWNSSANKKYFILKIFLWRWSNYRIFSQSCWHMLML